MKSVVKVEFYKKSLLNAVFHKYPYVYRFKNVPITPNSYFKITKMQRINKIKEFCFISQDEGGNSYSTFDLEQFKLFIKV